MEDIVVSIIVDNNNCTLFIPAEKLQQMYNCNIGVFTKERSIVLFLYTDDIVSIGLT